MKRPKTSSTKTSWFGIAGVFLLAIALAVGVTTNTQAATGSFDRDAYFPEYGSNDYDRAWISVTDTSGNISDSKDTITVTIKAGSVSTTFVLKETGNTSTVFTTTGSTQAATYPVGSTSGYVEDFNSGSHNFPALGTTVVGLNLRELTANTGGNASTNSDGALTVSSGTTLELLYGGSTLDTAVVKTNSGSFTFSPSAVSAVTTDSSVSGNVILSITDMDENLNPVAKDVIGFADNSALLSGSPGTGSSRVQIEAIDQTTSSTLTLGGTSIVARNIMLVETGNNTGVFTASGKVFGTSTTVASTDLKGNVLVGSSSTSTYTGTSITLGTTTTNAVSCTFKIIEANAPGRIGLYEAGTTTTGGVQPVLGFVSPATGSFVGTSSLSLSKVVAMGTTTSLFGVPSSVANQGTNTSGLLKLIDGTNYCVVAISRFSGTTTGNTIGGTYEIGNGGSVTVEFASFQLAGPRSGDTLKVSYLDEFNAGGTSGTVTGTAAYGVAGETGTLSTDSTTPDINDLVTITVVDGNLNTSSSSKDSVVAGSSLWGGTTTNNRGDKLTVKSYSTTGKKISVAHPDGYGVGTQTVRISSTDNAYVWMVPSSLTGTFQSPLSTGSTTFSLGTESVSSVPLIRGASSGADSFLSSASTSSFVATLDGLDNTLEISPDGTFWISVPITEDAANSGTFVGVIGFDHAVARLTTNTSASVTSVISDSTGTSTLTFANSGITDLSAFIGTGSVVRIFDGSVQEFAEVTSPGATTLTVTKLTNSTAFDPDNTWVQVIGADMSTARLDTNTDETEFFRIGGYFGATYRIRYNDAVGASNAYLGGNTLAITTSNVGFTTYTGSLSTDITGSTGPDTYVVVTLVDEDLNTSNDSAQATFEADRTTSGTGDIIFRNENGLGLPSGSSTGNVSRGFKNGGTAKILYASTLSNILTSSVDQAGGGNTIDFALTETANNSGTFKGSFQLSSGTSTTNTSDVLKVSNGNSVYVFYNDSPSASAADNSSSYTATDPITIVTSLGNLSLSKDTAYLSGDTVVVTVVDVDRNTSLTSEDTLTTAIKVTGSNYSVGSDLTFDLIEDGVNTGTFLATFTTGTTTSGGGAGLNSGTIKTVQGGVANVIYTDTSPSSSTATKNISFSASDATLAFGADSYGLNSYALVTLVDAERNDSISTAQSLLSDVFINTSSNSTKVRMVESSLDTGTFLGSIKVASSGGTTEFSQIQAAEGDEMTITYIDTVNTTGSSRTVSDTASVTEATPTPSPTPTATPGVTPTVTASPTVTPSVTPTIPGVITGTVVDAISSAPIAGATVSTDTGGYSATTDADGLYQIPDVAAGGYLVTASATGYDPATQPVTVGEGEVVAANFTLVPTSVTPTPGVTPTPVPTIEPCVAERITLDPTSPIKIKRKKTQDVTVRVTGSEFCAVEGEEVKATINKAGKKRISISSTSATTGPDGQATFTITAKKKTGNARITFKAGDAKRKMTVRVRK